MDHCNGTGATTPGAKTFLSDNTGIYSELRRVCVFQEVIIEPIETDEFSIVSHLKLNPSFISPWALRRWRESSLGQSTCSVSRQMSLSPLHGGWPVCPLPAMVQWSPHLLTWPHGVLCSGLCWPGHGTGPEIALQPFNKSCPSLEYFNFSLCRGGVTCHHRLPWKPVKDVFSPLGN